MTLDAMLQDLHESSGPRDDNTMEKAILEHQSTRAELAKAKSVMRNQELTIQRLSALADIKEEAIERLTRERNFYMTHSVRLATQLDAIASFATGHAQTLNDMIAAARTGAVVTASEKTGNKQAIQPDGPLEKPAIITPPRGTEEDDDEESLREIARRFAPAEFANNAPPAAETAGLRALRSLRLS